MATATENSAAVQKALKQAGLSPAAELSDEQYARAENVKPEWAQAKTRKFIMEGEGAKADSNGQKTKPKTQDRGPDHALAKDAEKLAAEKDQKLGSSITTKQAAKVREMLKERTKNGPAKTLWTGDEKALLAYAHGGSKAELPEELSTALREFCRAAEDRRIWPRKVAALVLALRRK